MYNRTEDKFKNGGSLFISSGLLSVFSSVFYGYHFGTFAYGSCVN